MKTFKPITEEDMMTNHKDDVFWYVFDEKNQQIIATPNDQAMEPIGYVFQEEEDAETWKFVLSTTPAYQDLKLSVEGADFQSVLRDVEETLGEFRVTAISHAEAKNLFENYEYILQTREFEEERNKKLDEFNDTENF
ncbi:MAG: hypothetical protein M3388_05030 [Acidobacteriota bacterium]|nr:hypothetical protein [Acidobacteriota bacterium]